MSAARAPRVALPLVLAAAALLSACTSAQPGRVPDASAPPKSAFEAYPAAEVKDVKNPHDYRGKPLCQRCHAPDLALVKQANELCKDCHKAH